MKIKNSIDSDAINQINKGAAHYAKDVMIVANVAVRRKDINVYIKNVGFGPTYEEALENLLTRSSFTGDKADIVGVEFSGAYVGETLYIGFLDSDD